MNWPVTLMELAARGEPFVIVTVAATRGSTPRETGAKMFVTPSRTLGTIGGGQLEYDCTAAASQWLSEPAPARTFARTFTLGANCGQCCGGVAEILFEQIVPTETRWLSELKNLIAQDIPALMVTAGDSRTGVSKRFFTADAKHTVDDTVAATALGLLAANAPASRISVNIAGNLEVPALFEPLQASQFEIVLFGAGHVGSALIATLAPLNCHVTWVDSRPDIFPARLPENIRTLGVSAPETLVGSLPNRRYYLVMTHSHALDLRICSAILSREDFSYCGLIGSRSKRRQFEKRLRALGLSERQLERLTCPIGIDGITGKSPAEIALATTAQLLKLREAELARQPLPVTGRRRKAGQ